MLSVNLTLIPIDFFVKKSRIISVDATLNRIIEPNLGDNMKKIAGLATAILCLFTHFPAFADNIKVVVASQNPIKTSAVREAFQEQFPSDNIDIFEYKSESGIPEQPIGNLTAIRGANNRLQSVPQEVISSANYSVSVENYIEQTESKHTWNDIGLILVNDLSQTNAEKEKIVLTQPVQIPEHFVNLAKELSPASQITDEGYPITVGEAIQKCFKDKSVNPHDWHREPEFGGISRLRLIKEGVFKALNAKDIAYLKSQIVTYKDFPKPGILFQDFLPIMINEKSFKICIDLLYNRYKNKDIKAVVGLESRGFILGSALAYKLGVGFIPVRKPGKLPGPIYTVSYEKEYGSDTLSISQSALGKNQRVLIIDDLIATGGTAKAAIELVKMANGEPVEFASILEIKELEGRGKLGIPSFNLID